MFTAKNKQSELLFHPAGTKDVGKIHTFDIDIYCMGFYKTIAFFYASDMKVLFQNVDIYNNFTLLREIKL